MSESPEAPEGLPENFETKVILNLLFIQTRRSSKGKVKESKSQKMKELVFIFLDNNYVEFLQMLLAKHSQVGLCTIAHPRHTDGTICVGTVPGPVKTWTWIYQDLPYPPLAMAGTVLACIFDGRIRVTYDPYGQL